MEPNRQGADNKGKNICKFFLVNKCHYGDKCKNLHQQQKPAQALEKKNSSSAAGGKNISPYLTGLAESGRRHCTQCNELKYRVYLGCGCHDLCEECAGKNAKCGLGHDYESQYIV